MSVKSPRDAAIPAYEYTSDRPPLVITQVLATIPYGDDGEPMLATAFHVIAGHMGEFLSPDTGQTMTFTYEGHTFTVDAQPTN